MLFLLISLCCKESFSICDHPFYDILLYTVASYSNSICLLVFVTVKLTIRGSSVKLVHRWPKRNPQSVCLMFAFVLVAVCKALLQECSTKTWYSYSRVNIVDDSTCHDYHNFTAMKLQKCIGLMFPFFRGSK